MSTTDLKPSEIESYVFQKLRFGVGMVIPEHIVESLTIKEIANLISDEIRVRVTGYVMGKDAEEVVEVPRTWWDHFKLRFFPEWALNTWPPRLDTYRARAFFPDIPLPETQNGVYGFHKEFGDYSAE